MSKSHLANSIDPLTEHQKILALCGEIVPNAVFTFRWLPGEVNYELFSTLRLCQGCLAQLKQDSLGKHSYLYGIQSGEEVKQEEAA